MQPRTIFERSSSGGGIDRVRDWLEFRTASNSSLLPSISSSPQRPATKKASTTTSSQLPSIRGTTITFTLIFVVWWARALLLVQWYRKGWGCLGACIPSNSRHPYYAWQTFDNLLIYVIFHFFPCAAWLSCSPWMEIRTAMELLTPQWVLMSPYFRAPSKVVVYNMKPRAFIHQLILNAQWCCRFWVNEAGKMRIWQRAKDLKLRWDNGGRSLLLRACTPLIPPAYTGSKFLYWSMFGFGIHSLNL